MNDFVRTSSSANPNPVFRDRISATGMLTTFYTWRRVSDDMKFPEMKGPTPPEEENVRLRKLPCLIRRILRWLRALSSDDRSEEGQCKSCVRPQVCRITRLPAGRAVPVRLLTHTCLWASLRRRLNVAVLITSVSGSFCDVQTFKFITSGFTALLP